MKFTKMHGIGNDYVYVNALTEKIADPMKSAILISDRHFGVGADGLVLILPSERADVRMRMFNADGSEAEMCGNGVRCVAKYAYDHGLSKSNPMRVETGRGVLTLHLDVRGGRVEQVTVNMGEPILEAGKIPVELADFPGDDRVVDVPIKEHIPLARPLWMHDCGVDPRMTCVSMGNPHVCIYCRYIDGVPLATVGSSIERAAIFPHRANVHFVQVVAKDEIIMRSWERGSGVTLACGTGACAACVAGVLTGRTSRKITARLPGGQLALEWRESDNCVYMTGPAAEVFSGEWPER